MNTTVQKISSVKIQTPKKDPQRVYSNSLKQERNGKTSWKPGLLTLILSFAALAQQLLGAVDSGEGRLDLAADVPGFGAVAYWYEEQDHLRDRDWNQAAEEIRCKERYHERFRNMQRLDHSGCLVFVDVFVFGTMEIDTIALFMDQFWTSKIQDMESWNHPGCPKYRFVSQPGGRLLKRASLADVYLEGLLGKRGAALVAGGHDRTVDLIEHPIFSSKKNQRFF